MQLAIQIIGVIIIAEGILFVLKPAVCRKLIAFFSRGRRLYLVGTLRTILAIIFLIVSSECNIPLVIIALGILFLISGIAVFTMRLERQKAILNRWEQKSPTVLRLAAIIALLIGAAVVYAA